MATDKHAPRDNPKESGRKSNPAPPTIHDDDDDALVDFGSMPPPETTQTSRAAVSGPLSFTSVVSWTDLMKEGGSAVDLGSTPAVEFDAISDKDILKKVLADEPPSGNLVVGANEALPPEETGEAGSGTHPVLPMTPEQEESVFAELMKDEDETSSVFNALDAAARKQTGSSQHMQKTDEFKAPLFAKYPDDDAADELAAAALNNIESSAVNLGSESVIDLPYPVEAEAYRPRLGPNKPRSASGSGFSGEDSGTVDLLGSGRGTGLSSLPGLTAVGSGMRQDTTLPSTTRVPPTQRLSWLGGGLLGILTALAICIGVWSTGALQSGGKKEIPQQAPAVTYEAGLAMLDNGDLDKAIAVLSKMEQTPEVSTALGQGRFLRYMRECKAGNQAPKADSEEAVSAAADLKAANTAAANLWLGLMQETFGKPDAAKAIYLDAQGRFAPQAKLFQAALDRLETQPAPGPRAANNPFGAALFTLLLQAEPTQPDEAGFEFWKALRLAKEHKYQDALKSLDAAKKAHDARRFALARKGLNPTSDPLEEIFLRCCDELRDYWSIRHHLHTNGYDLAKQTSVSSAVTAVLNEAKKRADDAKEFGTRLAAIKDALRDSGFDLNDLVGAVNKLVKAKETADKAKDAAEAMTKSAQADKTAAETAKKTADAELATAQTQIGKLDTELADAKKKLAAAMESGGSAALVAKLEARVKELEGDVATAKAALQPLQIAARELTSFLRSVAERVKASPGAKGPEVLVKLDEALADRAKPGMPAVLPGAAAINPGAERAYGRGLAAVQAGDMVAAEREFAAAVKVFGWDARYWYFAGLAKTMQGRAKEAAEDFRQGRELEQRNLPSADVINASLERLPVGVRRTLTEARGR